MKSLKGESALGRQTSIRVFFAEFLKVMDSILSRSKVLVACEKDNHDTILGYLVFELPDTIHYAYTKAALRRLNICKDLVKTAFPDSKSLNFTFNTNDAKSIVEKYPELIHNPFTVFRRDLNV